ncbi:major facilitator superfamily transporter [Trichoderma evansii]
MRQYLRTIWLLGIFHLAQMSRKMFLQLKKPAWSTQRYDVSNVANIQAPLYNAFGHIETLPWVALSYSLIYTASAPLVTRLLNLGDIRITTSFFFALFIASSVVAVGRPLTGLANTGVYQIGNLNLISLFYSPAEASRIGGMVGMSWAIGLVIGPFVGGGFADNQRLTWRWAFYIVTPFLGVSMFAAVILLPNYNPSRGLSLQQSIHGIDWLGGLLHLAIVILFALVSVHSGSSWDWNSGHTIAIWVIIGIFLITYFIQQYSSFLTTPMPGLLALAAICISTCYAVSLYYLPLFFAFTRNATTIEAAVHIIPFIGVFIVAVMLSGVLMPKIGYYAPFHIIAGAVMVIGGSLMTQITPITHDGANMGYQALLGVAVGLVFANSYSVANASLHDPDGRLASAALFNIASMGGISLALVIASCIYQNIGFRNLQVALKPFGFEDQDIRQALSGLASPVLRPDDTTLRDVVVHIVTKVIARLFYIVVGAGVICLLLGLCMPWGKLDFKRPQEVNIRDQ